MPKPTILIIGGAGYIGSQMTHTLLRKGYQPIVFDNLSQGMREAVKEVPFIHGDLNNRKDLDNALKAYSFDAVMHFAAHIDAGESVTAPLKYYRNNVTNTLQLLEAMIDHNILRLIFSSSAAIFGLPQQPTINENHPREPINPYGQTKLMIEKVLEDLDQAHGLKSFRLRYFNAAGGDPAGEVPQRRQGQHNLIPLVLQSIRDGKTIRINGTDYETPDGTCIRDYIHIQDIAQAHLLALEHLLEGSSSKSYNLGNGQGFSVREVLAAAQEVTKLPLKVIEGPRRAGDPPMLVANAAKAKKEMGWQPLYPDLKTMIAHAWKALH